MTFPCKFLFQRRMKDCSWPQLHRARIIIFLLSKTANRANAQLYYTCVVDTVTPISISGSTSKTDTKVLSDLYCNLKSKLGRENVSLLKQRPSSVAIIQTPKKRRGLVVGTRGKRLLHKTNGGCCSIASRGDRQDECRWRSPLLEVELMSNIVLL